MTSSNTANKPSLITILMNIGGYGIGWLGAALVLLGLATQQETLKGIGNTLMTTGPLMGAPALTRSAWVNNQPSWVLCGASFVVFWIILILKPNHFPTITALIFMVGFLFTGLSNMVHPNKPSFNLQPFTTTALWSNPTQLLSTLAELGAFIVKDFALTVQVGLQGTMDTVLWPLMAVKHLVQGQGLPAAPSVFNPSSLWAGRRFGGFYFSLAGLLGMLSLVLPGFGAMGKQLFDTVGGLGAIIVNYSLFFSGLQGKHLLDKMLIPGSLLATIGSFARSQPWGFALDQFGSRLNEIYYTTLQFRLDEEASATEAE
jgi:hypothetical protein